jgi:hypothetical protein
MSLSAPAYIALQGMPAAGRRHRAPLRVQGGTLAWHSACFFSSSRHRSSLAAIRSTRSPQLLDVAGCGEVGHHRARIVFCDFVVVGVEIDVAVTSKEHVDIEFCWRTLHPILIRNAHATAASTR